MASASPTVDVASVSHTVDTSPASYKVDMAPASHSLLEVLSHEREILLRVLAGLTFDSMVRQPSSTLKQSTSQ